MTTVGPNDYKNYARFLSDPESFYSFDKEKYFYLVDYYLDNSMKGRKKFKAICLSGAAKAENVSTTNPYHPIKIRPEFFDELLPDPCGEDFKEDPVGAKFAINMHPTAIGFNPMSAGQRSPGFGEELIVEYICTGPENFGKQRCLRYHFPQLSVKYDYTCANKELQSLVGQFAMIAPTQISQLPTPPQKGLSRGDAGPPPTPLPSSKLNGGIIKKFETDLGALLKSKGLPFKVTDRSRNVSQQMSRIMRKYNKNKSGAEVIATYGSLGRKMVKAIKAGDNEAFRSLASRSSRHLKGAAIDIRVWHYTDAQVATVLKAIRSLGGNPLVEPLTGGCWDKPGRNVTHPKRLKGIKFKGCYNQHIHIDIPRNYPNNLSNS